MRAFLAALDLGQTADKFLSVGPCFHAVAARLAMAATVERLVADVLRQVLVAGQSGRLFHPDALVLRVPNGHRFCGTHRRFYSIDYSIELILAFIRHSGKFLMKKH
ncbi:hypothetical protein XAP6164_4910024 [Xanthomonas phaseoli pv. phaseoli]|nr:hypothetical protein XAP6164_4910024 [Xanthomonas phaseoli pv. phaseoli]